MIERELNDFQILGLCADFAIIKRIDTRQKIIVCDILAEGEEIPTGLAEDRYYFYEGDKKNIPFADLTQEEIEQLPST